MSGEDPRSDEGEEIPVTVEESSSGPGPRERLEEQADRAVEGFDQGLVDLLAWILDTETRARIYVYLRQSPASTSEEVAEGTGLYPSTVREALAEMHDEGTVDRRKRDSEGAGNNPYEYTAIAPSELVKGVVGEIQDELNTVINLDRYLGEDGTDIEGDADEPITISVDETDSPTAAQADADLDPDTGADSDADADADGDGDADPDDSEQPRNGE